MASAVFSSRTALSASPEAARALQDRSRHFGETWFLYDSAAGEHRIVAADLQGNFDVFEGLILEDKKVFTNSEKPWPNGKDIIWRRTYYNIEADSHEVLMEYSFDGGYSWTKANRWNATRLQE